MPTYEYRCPEGHEFEVFQRISDEPGATCPECGRPAERLISAGAGFLFKGGGFYITDYRSQDYKKKASSESGGDGKAEPAKAADAKGGEKGGEKSEKAVKKPSSTSGEGS
jgi:putative FmdB family regulatory protein